MKTLARATAVICVWLSASGPVSGQTRNAAPTVAVSYLFRQNTGYVYTVPFGLLVSLGGDVNRVVSPIVELGASFRPRSRGLSQIYTLQGGVRIAPMRHHAVRPFGEVLGGISAGRCCGDAAIWFVVQPGGGVDIPISDRASVQVAAGVPFVIGEGATLHVRLRAGVSLALGSDDACRPLGGA